MIGTGHRILFQGDSITDAGRDRTRTEVNDALALGRGYAYLASARLLRDHPRHGLLLWNRGISGNRVPDLLARWQTDCLALQPNLVSILIGVNDLWHKFDGRYTGSVADYEQGYRELIEQTLSALKQASAQLEATLAELRHAQAAQERRLLRLQWVAAVAATAAVLAFAFAIAAWALAR